MSRILIVDDDPALVNLLKESLEAEGYEISVAYDGSAALACIEHRAPEALVIDQNMPDLTGADVIQRLRATPAYARLPAILLTGESNGRGLLPRDPRTLHIEKPVDLEALTISLQTLLRTV